MGKCDGKSRPATWRDIATNLQQNLMKHFGKTDWNSYSSSRQEELEAEVGYALFGPPSYDPTQTEHIRHVCSMIVREDVHCIQTSDTWVSTLFVCMELEVTEGQELCIATTPVFKVPKYERNHPDAIRFIDSNGRVYKNWRDYLQNNQIPKCSICYPKDGTYRADNTGNVIVEFGETPSSNETQRILAMLDKTSSSVAIGCSFVTLVSLVHPVSDNILSLAAWTSGIIGAYGAARSAATLVDRMKHKQSVSLANLEARNCWLSVGGTVIGTVSTRATSSFQTAVRSGQTTSKLRQIAVTTLGTSSLAISATGLVNNGAMLYQKYKEDKLTPLDVYQIATSAVFFVHSTLNTKTAGAIIKETQKDFVEFHGGTACVEGAHGKFCKVERGPWEGRFGKGPWQGKSERGPWDGRFERGPREGRFGRGPWQGKFEKGPWDGRFERGPWEGRFGRGPWQGKLERGPWEGRRNTDHEKPPSGCQKMMQRFKHRDELAPRLIDKDSGFWRTEKNIKFTETGNVEINQKLIIDPNKFFEINTDQQKVFIDASKNMAEGKISSTQFKDIMKSINLEESNSFYRSNKHDMPFMFRSKYPKYFDRENRRPDSNTKERKMDMRKFFGMRRFWTEGDLFSGIMEANKDIPQSEVNLTESGWLEISQKFTIDPMEFFSLNNDEHKLFVQASKEMSKGKFNRKHFEKMMKTFHHRKHGKPRQIENIAKTKQKKAAENRNETKQRNLLVTAALYGPANIYVLMKNFDKSLHEKLCEAAMKVSDIMGWTPARTFLDVLSLVCNYVQDVATQMETKYQADLEAARAQDGEHFNQELFDRNYKIQGKRFSHFCSVVLESFSSDPTLLERLITDVEQGVNIYNEWRSTDEESTETQEEVEETIERDSPTNDDGWRRFGDHRYPSFGEFSDGPMRMSVLNEVARRSIS